MLIQRNYGTKEITDALEYVAPSLEPRIVVRMSGDVKKQEPVILTIDNKTFLTRRRRDICRTNRARR